VKNWIYLSKNGTDEYIELFAQGAKVAPTVLETWRYEASQSPLVIRGILKHKIMKQCWADNRKFLYMDSGYIGNRRNPLNPNGFKIWHRLVPNDLQHNEVVPRPDDRWRRLQHPILPLRQRGSKILLAVPDEKPCKFYGVDLETWTRDTVNLIKQYTDRPIEIRDRNPNRRQRLINDMETALQDDVWALVTFNSVAATEAVLAGVPAFVLAPCNAARPVANTDLSLIEAPWFPPETQRQLWANHLAYGQFNNKELADGTAHHIIKETFDE
jgi:hypothetical protein